MLSLKKKYWVGSSLLLLALCGCESTDVTNLVALENGQNINDDPYPTTLSSASVYSSPSIPVQEDVVSSFNCPVNTKSSANFCFDVIIRDFDVSHPDFENFPAEYAGLTNRGQSKKDLILAAGYPGYSFDWYSKDWYHLSCGNSSSRMGVIVGVDGLPMITNSALPPYLQNSSEMSALRYGECATNSKTGMVQRGFAYDSWADNQDILDKSCTSRNMAWSDSVYYTPGMVYTNMYFVSDQDGKYEMLNGANVVKAGDYCDNQYFEQWFTDVIGVNKRTNSMLYLAKDFEGRGNFVVDYDYNNGGFFPLDSIDPVTDMWYGLKTCDASSNGICDQYGPQSLSIYCPPYNYEYASDQRDRFGKSTATLCSNWLTFGGPRTPEAAAAAAGKTTDGTGIRHLRNYHFTVQGYAQFEYNSEDKGYLQFMSIDDMWVFVDGVLVHDGGGDHQPVPSPKISLNKLAVHNHGCNENEPLAALMKKEGACDDEEWIDGSIHRIWFFYANRQTEGSTFFIRAKI